MTIQYRGYEIDIEKNVIRRNGRWLPCWKADWKKTDKSLKNVRRLGFVTAAATTVREAFDKATAMIDKELTKAELVETAAA